MPSTDFFTRLDAHFDRWSERFHPIVVKETRQTIRSFAFPAAFLGMLAICLASTLLLASHLRERLATGEVGPEFLRVYLAALLGAICLVVPLGLFRSVTSEFDGQTFETLAITNLSPRQVVLGRLKSSGVQMLAFYFAAAPFLSFTYLLQGVSLLAILLTLVIAYVAGISACLGAMMLGALAKQSMWQIPCVLLTVIQGTVMLILGYGTSVGIIMERGTLNDLIGICSGFGCFIYVFAFFVLMTLGVSIAQFTPTVPRPIRT